MKVLAWIVAIIAFVAFVTYIGQCDENCRLKQAESCKPYLVATAPDGVRLWRAPCESVYFSSGGAQWSHTVGKSRQTITVPSGHE